MKTNICLSLNFLKIMLKVRLRFSLILFLTFMSLFSFIVCLVRFSTYNKLHVLTYMLTRVFKVTTYDGTTLIMKTEKIFK